MTRPKQRRVDSVQSKIIDNALILDKRDGIDAAIKYMNEAGIRLPIVFRVLTGPAFQRSHIERRQRTRREKDRRSNT